MNEGSKSRRSLGSSLYKPTSTTRKFGGTGLGLYISKQPGALGGRLEAQSQVGQGSRFVLIAPFLVGVPASRVRPLPSDFRFGAVSTPAAAPLRVLIVDDNPMDQLVAQHSLKSWASTRTLPKTASRRCGPPSETSIWC